MTGQSLAETLRAVHQERQAETLLAAANARLNVARGPEEIEMAEADAHRAQTEVVRHRLSTLLPSSAGSSYAIDRIVLWLRSAPSDAATVGRLADALLVDPRAGR